MSYTDFSMGGLIVHVFRVAFFVEKDQRISRGEYWLGCMSLFFTLAIACIPFTYLITLPNHGPDDAMTDIDFLLAMLAIVIMSWLLPVCLAYINLSIKRLHDIDKSGWWLLTIFVPFVNIYTLIMILMKVGSKHSNRFGDDPRDRIPQDDLSYWGMTISLLFVSLVLIIGSIVFLVPDPEVII